MIWWKTITSGRFQNDLKLYLCSTYQGKLLSPWLYKLTVKLIHVKFLFYITHPESINYKMCTTHKLFYVNKHWTTQELSDTIEPLLWASTYVFIHKFSNLLFHFTILAFKQKNLYGSRPGILYFYAHTPKRLHENIIAIKESSNNPYWFFD